MSASCTINWKARVEKVAHQDRGRVAELGVGGRPAPAQAGNVDHVVVQQGGGVDELDDRGELDVLGRHSRPRAARTEQHEQGAQALAAGIDDIMADVLDHVGTSECSCATMSSLTCSNSRGDGGAYLLHGALGESVESARAC